MRLSVPMSVGIGHLALLLRQSGAEADVDVHVGAGVVVAVAVEYTSVGTVVIVATAVGQTLYPSPYGLPCSCACLAPCNPAVDDSADLGGHCRPPFIMSRSHKLQTKGETNVLFQFLVGYV